MRTRIAVTADEISDGIPNWGTNQNVTDVPLGQTQVAIENLVAGRRYYVKTWNEDDFGNKSGELTRVVDTATPLKLVPYSFGGVGAFDSDSPMYAYVKIPDSIQSVVQCLMSLSFRQFMATARDAASSGTLTSDSGGGATTPSGGGSTTTSGGGSTSGSSSASSSDDEFVHNHRWGLWSSDAAAGGLTTRNYAILGTTGGQMNLPTSTTFPSSDLWTEGGTTHKHGIAHNHSTPNHTHSTPNHIHSTPDHQHTTPGHIHELTYGTFEESYPISHSVTVKVYQLVEEVWTLVSTTTGLTADKEDLDLTTSITGPGDWQIRVVSEAAQPNNGRLACDLFGAITGVSATGGTGSETLGGTPGAAGSPGVGVPVAGTIGQVLVKLSGADYDTGWLTLGTAAAAATTDFDAAGAAASAQTAAEAYADAADAVTLSAAESFATAADAALLATAAGDFDALGAAATAQGVAEAFATAADVVVLAARQPLNSNLTDIVALTPSNDDIIQRKAGHWTNRTIAQYITDLGLGALAFLSSLGHSSLTGIGADDHHAKSHAHNGADGSGTVAHSATTGKTANDHHLGELGFTPGAWAGGFPNTTSTPPNTETLAISGGSLAFWFLVPAPMTANGIAIRQKDVASAHTLEFRLYYDPTETGATATQVAGTSIASIAYTPGAVSTVTGTFSAPVALAPGIYFGVLRNTSATVTAGIGSSNTLVPAMKGMATKTLASALDTTLDLITGWTGAARTPTVILTGLVLGESAGGVWSM